MKQNMFEMIVYGVFSALFGMAFFFGLLNPGQLLKADVCKLEKPIAYEGHLYQAEEFEELSDEKKLEILMHISPNQLRARSAIVSYMKR